MRQGLSVVIAFGLTLAVPNSGHGGEGFLPDSRLGIRTAPLLLLSRDDVRTDIGLDQRRASDADSAIRSLHVRARELRGKSGDEAAGARRAIDEEQQRWLESHLSPAQQQRLVQIDLQWEGPSALASRARVAETLGLSQTQRTAIARAVEAVRQKRDAGTFQPTDEVALAREALQTLTEAQRARWKAMLGPPFQPRLAAAAKAPRH
jgi:hypothetical protein